MKWQFLSLRDFDRLWMVPNVMLASGRSAAAASTVLRCLGEVLDWLINGRLPGRICVQSEALNHHAEYFYFVIGDNPFSTFMFLWNHSRAACLRRAPSV
jgi:hypothetical protein